MARVGQIHFVGRRRLLEKCRTVLDSGGPVFLWGEHGVGKTALAKRAAPGAIYLPHSNPPKELLSPLLVELWRRGLWKFDEFEGLSEAEIERKIRRFDQKSATLAAVAGLKNADSKPVLILDEFEGATASVVRVARQLAPHCLILACGVSEKPAQKPFLFGFEKLEVPRLCASESEELGAKLLDEFAIPERERPALLRHLVEQAQGLPSVLQELVARAARKGEVSLRAVQSEDVHGHKTVDMTPGLVIGACVVLAARYAVRGLGDADLTVIAGLCAAAFVGLRFYAYRLARPARQTA